MEREEFLKVNARKALDAYMMGGSGSSYYDSETVELFYGGDIKKKMEEKIEECREDYYKLSNDKFRKKWSVKKQD